MDTLLKLDKNKALEPYALVMLRCPFAICNTKCCINVLLTTKIDDLHVETRRGMGIVQSEDNTALKGISQCLPTVSECQGIRRHLVTEIQLPLENVGYALDAYLAANAKCLDSQTYALLVGVCACVTRTAAVARTVAEADDAADRINLPEHRLIA
ncbi:MAG: hypothetical protein AAGK00_13980 [Pseudomonadota bacterium]